MIICFFSDWDDDMAKFCFLSQRDDDLFFSDWDDDMAMFNVLVDDGDTPCLDSLPVRGRAWGTVAPEPRTVQLGWATMAGLQVSF